MRLRIASCLGFVSLGVVPFEVAADPVPTRAQAALEAGHAHYAANELERAVAQYEAALQLAPDLSEAWFFKARSHETLADARIAEPGEDASAVDAQRAAHRAKGIEAYRRFLESGRMRSADQDFEAEGYQRLAKLYADTPGSGAKAVETAQAFARSRPESIEALSLLAKIHERLDSVTEAEAAYRALVTAAPADPKVCDTAAVFYTKRHWDGASRFQQAVAEFERCTALTPGRPEAYCRLASIYWDEAFRNSLLTDPEADGLADRGLAVAELGLARQPDHRECLVYKAQLLRVKAQRAPTEELRLRYRNEAQQVQRAAVEAMRRQRAEKP